MRKLVQKEITRQYTLTEIQEMQERVVELVRMTAALDEEKKRMVKKFGDEIKELELEMRIKANEIRRGETSVVLQCKVKVDHKKGTVTFRNAATDEVVAVEPISDEYKQTDAFDEDQTYEFKNEHLEEDSLFQAGNEINVDEVEKELAEV